MRTVKIKICGITNLEDAQFCAEAGVDALGFIFVKKSPRCILPEVAAQIISKMPKQIANFGIFVDENLSNVFNIIEKTGIDTVQFHGNETPEYCRNFASKVMVVKSFFPQKTDDVLNMRTYSPDMFLIDTPWQEKLQSSEVKHNKNLVKQILKEFKWCIYSGGIETDNLKEIISEYHPYMIDICRGTEKSYGKKDRNKINEIFKIIKGIENEEK